MYASEWCKSQRELLALEHDEEKAGLADKLAQLSPLECEKEGLSLLGLELDGTKTGLYGRTVLSLLCKRERVSGNSFKVGDEVQLSAPSLTGNPAQHALATVTGVLLRSNAQGVLEMAVGGGPDDEVDEALLRASPPLRLDLLANDATHSKMLKALAEIEARARCCDGPAAPLLSMLFAKNVAESYAAAGARGGGLGLAANPQVSDDRRAVGS